MLFQMGNVFTAGPYEHNPWVGDRPQKYPYTLSAKIAQFPYVYHWRYCLLGKAAVYSAILGMPFFYWIQKKCKFSRMERLIFSDNISDTLYILSQHTHLVMSKNGSERTDSVLNGTRRNILLNTTCIEYGFPINLVLERQR